MNLGHDLERARHAHGLAGLFRDASHHGRGRMLAMADLATG
jgi:hypothetical protein